MAGLLVAPVTNPTLSNSFTPSPTINSVGVAHPAPLTNNVPAPTPAAPPPAANPIDAQIAALQAQIGAANQKVYAPALDTNAIFSKAGATAASNVNPYYTKLLNDFITQQGVTRQQQQQQTATNVQNLQDQLAQLQSANAVTGQRATEDTATGEAKIAQAADQRQSDQGTAFDATRTNQAVNLAESGLTGSGLGAKAQATTQLNQDTTEARQAEGDQQAKDVAELSKARTFEDLATSNKNATSAEAKGETQAQFDLNKFITGQTTDLQGEQQQLEQQRQQALQAEQQNQTKLLVNNFINSIANPAQRQAALQAYGSFL